MTRTPDIVLSVEVGSLGTGSENIPIWFSTEELIPNCPFHSKHTGRLLVASNFSV